jgi:nucleoside-diphosphate-sugar epimerase
VTRVALVTGAAGFIGSHLVDALLADGVAVRGVDAFTDYYDPERKRENLVAAAGHPSFELVTGDLLDLDAEKLLRDVDVVYHLAGQPGVRASWGKEFELYTRQNVLATQTLLEAAREAQLERFVFASSSSIYGSAPAHPTREDTAPRPVSPYGVTKLAAEHLCDLYHQGFGVPVITLRYFSVYGPRQRPDMALARFIEAIRAGERIEIFGDGRQGRDFTYVADAVAATRAAARRGEVGGIYNVAGAHTVTVLEIVALLEELLDRPVAVRHVATSAGEPRATGADISAARAALGYRPRTSLTSGVAAQVASAGAPRGARASARAPSAPAR